MSTLRRFSCSSSASCSLDFGAVGVAGEFLASSSLAFRACSISASRASRTNASSNEYILMLNTTHHNQLARQSARTDEKSACEEEGGKQERPLLAHARWASAVGG